jgi:hypothetical protein
MQEEKTLYKFRTIIIFRTPPSVRTMFHSLLRQLEPRALFKGGGGARWLHGITHYSRHVHAQLNAGQPASQLAGRQQVTGY